MFNRYTVHVYTYLDSMRATWLQHSMYKYCENIHIQHTFNTFIRTYLVGGFEHDFYFSIQLEMSSSQLTFTPSFFRGVGLNHQPVIVTLDDISMYIYIVYSYTTIITMVTVVECINMLQYTPDMSPDML